MKNLALVLLLCCALVLPACGGGTVVVAGASSITVLSITGGPFITVTPTVFQVTGTEFAQAAGTDAIVRFTAEGGLLAFNGGTSNTLDVPVTILDDGTVEGTTPSFLFPGIFNAFVTVILPGTAEGTSETAIAQFIGIQVDSSTPNIIPSDSQILLDIGGTGFSPPAGNVNVTFIAETGTPFLNGTTDTIGPVPGTVNTLSSILANAPIAGVNTNAAAFVSVEFVDLPGMPVIQSLNPIVTFVPPTVDSTSILTVPSEIPTPLTINGTGYGPVASNVNVTLMADAGTPFLNGTAASIDVVGTVSSNTTIDITTPIFQVATSTQPTAVAILLNSGAGGASVGPLFSVDRPTVDSVDLANVPSEIPTFLTITGTGFAPNASAPTVRFRAPTGTPFTGGVAFLDVTGTVVNDTTITCTTPRAGVSAAQVADIGVFLTTGITEILSAAPLVTFDPPTIGSVSPTMVESEIPETVTITGTGYGSATGFCTVTLSGAGTPFALGTASAVGVNGTITSPTTITFTSPISGVLADLNADVTLTFPTGASVTSPALLTIKTPTVTASSLANVASEIPTVITITGTGFAGGTPLVRFASAGTPFTGGTVGTIDATGVTIVNGTTITCTTPRAGVSVAAPSTIQVLLTGGLNPISAGNLITFDPPTIASLSPTMVESELPETVTITGTGFGSASGSANVTLSGAGTQFSLGTLPSLTVLGTIVNPTTITLTSPICGLQADLNADVTITFPTNAAVTAAAALLIKTPTVTASSLANVPSEIPTVITITGTGFAGTTPTVRFASAGTPFSGGTSSTIDATGVTIVNPTTITCTTPRGGVSVAAPSTIQVLLSGGLTPISAGNLITFDPPTITSLSPTSVESEIPQVVTITGTGFGSASGNANVTLSGAGTPFSLGTQPSLTVLGTIANPTTITFTSPICGMQADLNADVTITFPTNAAVTAAAALLIKAPTVVSSAPATVDSENPTLITITGSGFAGGTPTVRFASAGTPFTGGTLGTIDATGVTIVNPTTITCTTPRAGVNANTPSTIQVLLTGGLTPISAGNIITFNAATVTSCAPTQIDATTATLVTVTGTGFYAPGTVTMRFIAATGTPFSGSATLDVTGATVVNPTTVTATTPSLTLSNKVVCSVAIIFASGAAPTSGPGCTTFEVPPVAVDDNYGADGNVLLTVNVANGVIDGVGTDSDPDGDAITVSAFDAASVQGGTVAVAAAGSFTYDPPAGYEGADSFTYTITDGFLFDTATVNITVSGMVWFVDENATSAGDGRFTSPFDTLAAFIASPLDAAGDTIFLYSSATDYTGNLTLLANQILLGQGVDLVHPGGNSPSPLVASSTNPDINSTTGTTLTVAAGNTVRGLDIESTSGTALFGTGLTGTLNADTVNIAATGGPAIDIDGGTLAVTFGTVSSTGSTTDGIEVSASTGTLTTGATTINTATLEGIDLDSTDATFTFASIEINTSASDGIDLNAVTGALQVTGNVTLVNTAATWGLIVSGGTPDIDFGSLNTTGFLAGLRHQGGGSLAVSGATTISSTTGDGMSITGSTGDLDFANLTIDPGGSGIRIDGITSFTSTGTTLITNANFGVYVNNATSPDIDFNNLTITTPADDGIFLDGAGGTFDVTGRCFIDTPGNETSSPGLDHGIDIDGGSIAVTFADLDIVDSHGHGVEISNTSGAISITGDLGAGAEDSDIHNTDDVGIHCTTCTGTLTFRDLFIDDGGDAAVNGQESHGIRIDDCTGNIVIDGCLIDDCAETLIGGGQGFDNNCIQLRMDDGGTLPSLQITDCTFSGTESGGLGTTTDHGVFIRLEGGSVISDVDITGCLCSDVGRAFVEVLIDGDDSGDGPVISNLNVSDNGTVANPIETQAEGIHLRNNGTSVLPIFNFDRNVISGGSLSRGNGIRINLGEFPTGINATGTATGTINENDIDLVGDGVNDNGIDTQTQNDCNLILEIDDNDIDGGTDNGMRVRGFDTSDTQITVTNNDIGLNSVHLDAAVEVQTRSGSPVLCIDINGNDAALADVYRMIRDAGTFRLLNIGAGTHSAAQVDTFIEGQNTGNAVSTSAGYTQCTTISTP